MSPKPVLGVVDLQPRSPQVVRHVLALARERGCSALLLHVVHETDASAGFYRRHSGGDYILPMKEIAARLLRRLVDEVAGELEADSAPQVETLVVEGVPAGRIVEVAAREGVDTIVMLNDERRGLERLWYGSVAAEVMKHTDRDLVLMHPEPEQGSPVTFRPAMASESLVR